MKEQGKYEFTVQSPADGEPLDPVDLSMFEAWLSDVLDSADFGGLRIGELRLVEGE